MKRVDRRQVIRALASVVVTTGVTTVAHAVPVTWNVEATFEDGGTLSGSFVYDADAPSFALRFSELMLFTSGGDTAAFPGSTYTTEQSATVLVTSDRTLLVVQSDGSSFSELTIDFKNTTAPILSNDGGSFVATATDWDEFNGVTRRRLDANVAVPGRLWSSTIGPAPPPWPEPPFPPDVEALPDLEGRYGLVVLPAYPFDLAPPYSREIIEAALFGSGLRGMYTLTEWYSEVSLGRFTFDGTVLPWLSLPEPRAYYLDTANNGWLRFMWDTLVIADTMVDWSLYDNDGPDGLPNSGDDDGYVDMVIFIPPFAEINEEGCPPERRGPVPGNEETDFISGTGSQLRYWGPPFNQGSFATGQLGVNGRPLLVESFAIFNETFCPTPQETIVGDMKSVIHETGHALGLSDLYDRDASSAGVGTWDNMALGNRLGPEGRPVLFGAWNRTALGWGTVETVTTSRDYVLDPVNVSGSILRIDIPNTQEWFLLENRQRIGADEHLSGTGLLVWHIDAEVGRPNGWQTPAWDEDRPAVGVVQADGRNDLASRVNEGDAGDPFPGSSSKHEIDDCTVPSTRSNTGLRSGIEISMIEEIGQQIRLRVSIRDQSSMSLPVEQQLPSAVLGQEDYSARLTVLDGGCPFTWSTVGEWPAGWNLDAGGVITASPTALGDTVLGIRVVDGIGHLQEGVARVQTVMPDVSEEAVLEAVTGGDDLDAVPRRALDLAGNDNGRLDVGDAYLFITREP